MDTKMKYRIPVVALALLGSLAFLPNVAIATPSGISGFSGASGSTCTLCHSAGAAVPNVTITADSGSSTVGPGSITSYTITMTGGPASNAGLDLAASGGTIIDTNASGTRILNGELTMNSPNPVSGGTIDWTFNWQAPSATGTYTFNVAALSGDGNGGTSGDGTGTDTFQVTVAAATNQLPVAVVTAPTVGLEGATITFDGSGSSDPDGSIASYEWDFGDGSMGAGAVVTHVFAAGTYGVRLAVTDNAGDMASVIVGITIEASNVAPTAAISGPSNGTEGTAVSFDGSGSSDLDGTIAAYDWDFGDGSSGSGANVSHTYAAGVYTVALTVTDDAGATDTATMSIDIAAVTAPQAPIADAGGPYAALTNEAVQFDGSGSTDPDGSITSYDWDLGDGNSATGVGPSNIYTTAGTYTVTLTVTDNDGQTGSSQSTVEITDPPTPPDPTPATGEELWNTHCSFCHSGGVNGTSVSAINSAISNVGSMGYLSGVLSAADVEAISAFLSSGPTPTPDPDPGTGGEALYNSYCASCHGAGGTGGPDGGVLGEDARDIRDAIEDERDMRFLEDILSNDDISSIANYLSGNPAPVPDPTPTPDPGQTEGEILYNNFCAACHGAGGEGGKDGDVVGESAKDIREAIEDERPMRFLGAVLSDSDIKAIEAYLNQEDGDRYGDGHGDRHGDGDGDARSSDEGDGDGDRRRRNTSIATTSSDSQGATSGGGAFGWLSLLLVPLYLVRQYRR